MNALSQLQFPRTSKLDALHNSFHDLNALCISEIDTLAEQVFGEISSLKKEISELKKEVSSLNACCFQRFSASVEGMRQIVMTNQPPSASHQVSTPVVHAAPFSLEALARQVSLPQSPPPQVRSPAEPPQQTALPVSNGNTALPPPVATCVSIKNSKEVVVTEQQPKTSSKRLNQQQSKHKSKKRKRLHNPKGG